MLPQEGSRTELCYLRNSTLKTCTCISFLQVYFYLSFFLQFPDGDLLFEKLQ